METTHIKTKNVHGKKLEFFVCGINGDIIRDIDNYCNEPFEWPEDLSNVCVLFTLTENESTWFYVSNDDKVLLCGSWNLPLPNITKTARKVK